MIAAADTDQNGVVSFEEFVPMVRSQLGAVAPTTGWGHQSEADVLAQLLEHPAITAKCELYPNLFVWMVRLVTVGTDYNNHCVRLRTVLQSRVAGPARSTAPACP